jgi:leader peptidase (prepilin peptidase) / N-methyltransferase
MIAALLKALLPAAVIALATAVGAARVLRRLPEPAAQDIPAGEQKVPYADLAERNFLVTCGLTAFGLCWVSWVLLPLSLQPAWVVLGTFGALLALIDLRTTWVPRRLSHVAWLAMVAALALGAAAAGDGWLALRGALGALSAAALYSLVWAVSRGGFGFGDVRFAPLVGAAAAAVSWSVWIWALLLGTVAGGVVGLIRLARQRRGAFPYAPAILAGGYLGLTLSSAF